MERKCKNCKYYIAPKKEGKKGRCEKRLELIADCAKYEQRDLSYAEGVYDQHNNDFQELRGLIGNDAEVELFLLYRICEQLQKISLRMKL